MAIAGFLNTLFTSFSENNIEYCVLRNYEDMPDKVSNDIDICISKKQMDASVLLLCNAAGKTGWSLHLIIEKDGCSGFYFFKISGDELHQICFDLFPGYNYKGISLLSSSQVLDSGMAHKNFKIPGREIEIYLKFLSPLLHNGAVKEKYKHEIRLMADSQSSTFKKLLNSAIGEKLTCFILILMKNQDWDRLEKAHPLIAKAFIRESRAKNVFAFYRNKILYKYRQIKRIFNPKGLIIAVSGPDGSGKTSVIKEISSQMEKTFPPDKVIKYHWRPGLLPPLHRIFRGGISKKKGVETDFTNPHGKPPYSAPVSVLRLLYYSLDFILGYWVNIYIKKAKGNLIIFDRYYDDFFIDKTRFRLKLPDIVIAIISKLIPEPDMYFFLEASADNIFSRKPELSKSELERQLKQYSIQIISKRNGYKIDANQKQAKAARDLCLEMVQFMAGREKLHFGKQRKNL